MTNLSLTQALDVWSDLDDAYYGKHSFGGDTAEIYGYRLMPYEPGCYLPNVAGDEARARMATTAALSLHELLAHFADQRNCKIEVDGAPLAAGLPPLNHRCHVKVIRNE